ncbi:MAG: cardiolipin synthase [Chromatiales bacterium 21-64-14]|nr:MAG: cardiolipin synthase [Chromatiales bacterium 21-64-14]HQU15885.1 phospholipase D-like domain-containing protein [Gammaproteobacteria bacterium]
MQVSSDLLLGMWPYLAAAFSVLAAVLASGHAILHKRDPRAAVLWVGFIWLTPLLGPATYLIFGVNRIRRRARSLRGARARYRGPGVAAVCGPEQVADTLPAEARHLATLARFVERVVARPLVSGNRIVPYVDGDQAYPAMVEAIDGAQRSLTLATYIFDNDRVGIWFADALARAVARGVAVRVLIDDAGARYSWPTVNHRLRRAGVPAARFLPSLVPWRLKAMNLRNHRKILVADGRVGFTGGMNLRAGHLLGGMPRHPVRDLHFGVEGPVVAQLQEVFADDWMFTTGEELRGEAWFPRLEAAGDTLVRGIAEGPDEDFEKLRWTILGALATARHSVQILTPYFVPDLPIITALNVATLRGVEVDIVLPERSNLPFVNWASMALLPLLLEHGCRAWLTPPPFDHSKLMLVDGHWAMLGSANWDARSLRLNFEFNLECYGDALTESLTGLVRERMARARPVRLDELMRRPLAVRLRDGIARLWSPYL